MPKANSRIKVEYVLKESKKGSGTHHCHYPGCGKPCPPAKWGCYHCWMKLPKYLRDRLWRAYQPGQEKTKTPSLEYLKVAREIEEWCEKNR
jgi:hypothetical protein